MVIDSGENPLPWGDYQLGETHEDILCHSVEEQAELARSLLIQAERQVDILTHEFAPQVYDNEACFEAFEDFALRSRHSRVRVLVLSPRTVASKGHRILELGKRLNSYFQFRCPSERYQYLSQSFLVVDGIGVLYQPYQDSYRAHGNFCDAANARSLLALFNEIWMEAEEDTYLRNLSF